MQHLEKTPAEVPKASVLWQQIILSSGATAYVHKFLLSWIEKVEPLGILIEDARQLILIRRIDDDVWASTFFDFLFSSESSTEVF